MRISLFVCYPPAMTATLTINISQELLDALVKTKSVTIELGATGPGGGRIGDEQPREGSLPARVLVWAEKRNKTFRVDHVMSRFKLKRAHASMVLGKLANGPYAIQRPSRGVYAHSSVA